MVKHIVIFKGRGEDKEAIIGKLKIELDLLPQKIEEIKFYETGLNISESKNAYDLVLISEFESMKTLESYRVHPEHQKVVEYILKNEVEVKVVDYNI